MTTSPQETNRRGPGRPPLRTALVEGVTCSNHAKERLRLNLATMSGEVSVVDACATLGIGESRFHALRADLLAHAAEFLEPRTPGPAGRSEADAEAQRRIDELERANAQLARELRSSQAREELALSMPERMRALKKKSRAEPKPEPGPPVKRRWKRRRPKHR